MWFGSRIVTFVTFKTLMNSELLSFFLSFSLHVYKQYVVKCCNDNLIWLEEIREIDFVMIFQRDIRNPCWTVKMEIYWGQQVLVLYW